MIVLSPRLSRVLGRAHPGHPHIAIPSLRAWLPGTRPRMTKQHLPGFAPSRSAPETTVANPLIAVVIRLERAFRLDADIFSLIRTQLGQLYADFGKMQPGHLLVQRLRQHIDLLLVFAVLVVGEQLDLRQRLVGKRSRHYETRVTHGISEVHQPPL